MYVIFGASGRAGGETAGALMKNGERIRVVVRDAGKADRWRATGAEIAVANLEDPGAVARALEGSSGAFLLNPPNPTGDPFAQADRIGRSLAEALDKTELPKAVVLSSVGAERETGTGIIGTLHHIERLLADVVPAVTFLRPGYFVETWSEVADAVIANGVLPSFLKPDQKIPMVSTIDIGRTAAALLSEEWTGKQVVELRGPLEWSANDVAAAFADLLGRPVTTAFVPPDESAAILAQSGVGDQVAAALLVMYDGIAAGHVNGENGREQRRGSVSLETALRRIVDAQAVPAG